MNANWVHRYADPYPRYVAINGMNALAKRLVEDLTVQLNKQVENVQVEEDGTVTVKTDVMTRSYD